MVGKRPHKPESTLRLPERGTTESVRLPRPRPEQAAPKPAPSPELGTDVARSKLDARASSLPSAPVPDLQGRIEQLVRDLSRAGPEADEPLRRRARGFGPGVLGVAVGSFPGMLWVDLSRPHRPIRHARNLSALCVLFIDFGQAAVPYVASLLRSPSVDARICAALVAVDLPYGSLIEPLAARLHDEQPGVRDAAMLALRTLQHLPEVGDLRARLVATLAEPNAPVDWREKAAWALGQARDVQAIAPLIEALAQEEPVAARARDALARLTGRDLGRFRVRWKVWWRSARKRDRLEWLLDALDQKQELARVRALEELLLWTGRALPDDAGVETRERARSLQSTLRTLAL